MEFKISDDIVDQEEAKETRQKEKGKFNLVLIVIIALIVGLLIFFIFNAIFNPKVKTKPVEPVTEEKRSLSETNVKTLYAYVTYGANSKIRNDKYVKNKKVTLDDFTNDEKFYYGLMFVQVEDFEWTGNYDENKNKIYSISNLMIKKYIERYFGKGTKYSTDINIDKYPFTFSINDKNLGTMRYDEESDSWLTVFTGDGDPEKKDALVNPYLGKVVEAYKEVDGSYRLVENIVFADLQKQTDTSYDVSIYKDYEHKELIESATDLKETDLKKYKIENYLKNATTITYHFKLDGNVLVFDYSEIK